MLVVSDQRPPSGRLLFARRRYLSEGVDQELSLELRVLELVLGDPHVVFVPVSRLARIQVHTSRRGPECDLWVRRSTCAESGPPPITKWLTVLAQLCNFGGTPAPLEQQLVTIVNSIDQDVLAHHGRGVRWRCDVELPPGSPPHLVGCTAGHNWNIPDAHVGRKTLQVSNLYSLSVMQFVTVSFCRFRFTVQPVVQICRSQGHWRALLRAARTSVGGAMFAQGLERFESNGASDVIITEQTQTIIVINGDFELTRSFSHLGCTWPVPMKGRFHVLPPGTYFARGSALLWVSACSEPQRR